EVAVDREEQRVVRAGTLRLEPGVDVVGTARRLEPAEGTRRVAADGTRDEPDPVFEVGDRRRRDAPGLDDDGRRWFGVGRRKEPTAEERAAADGDSDGGVSVATGEVFGTQQVGDAGRDVGLGGGGQGDGEAVRGGAQPGEVLCELRGPAGPGAKGLEDRVAQLEAAVERGKVRPVRGRE